jgi:hypothetical protein
MILADWRLVSGDVVRAPPWMVGAVSAVLVNLANPEQLRQTTSNETTVFISI